MSFPFGSILHWAIDAAKTQVQQAALQAIKAGTVQLTSAITKHAPDVAEKAVQQIQDGVNHAILGIMTQRVKD